MELSFEFFVIKLLHHPFFSTMKYVCVPKSWIRINANDPKDKRIAVAYPATHLPTIKTWVKDKKPPHRSWNHYYGHVEFGNDNFQIAEIYLIHKNHGRKRFSDLITYPLEQSKSSEKVDKKQESKVIIHRKKSSEQRQEQSDITNNLSIIEQTIGTKITEPVSETNDSNNLLESKEHLILEHKDANKTPKIDNQADNMQNEICQDPENKTAHTIPQFNQKYPENLRINSENNTTLFSMVPADAISDVNGKLSHENSLRCEADFYTSNVLDGCADQSESPNLSRTLVTTVYPIMGLQQNLPHLTEDNKEASTQNQLANVIKHQDTSVQNHLGLSSFGSDNSPDGKYIPSQVRHLHEISVFPVKPLDLTEVQNPNYTCLNISTINNDHNSSKVCAKRTLSADNNVVATALSQYEHINSRLTVNGTKIKSLPDEIMNKVSVQAYPSRKMSNSDNLARGRSNEILLPSNSDSSSHSQNKLQNICPQELFIQNIREANSLNKSLNGQRSNKMLNNCKSGIKYNKVTVPQPTLHNIRQHTMSNHEYTENNVPTSAKPSNKLLDPLLEKRSPTECENYSFQGVPREKDFPEESNKEKYVAQKSYSLAINQDVPVSNDHNSCSKSIKTNKFSLDLTLELKPKNSKWTLRSQGPSPEVTELIPGSFIYINKRKLNECLAKAGEYKALARMLLLEIFKLNALLTCSLNGTKNNNRDNKPCLDECGMSVILKYVEEHGRANGWPPFDKQAVKISLKNKQKYLRAKSGLWL